MPAGQTLWTRLRADPAGLAGLAIVAFFLLLALGAGSACSARTGPPPTAGVGSPPGPQYWFGTNVLGQDIFERAVYSVRTAFEIGLRGSGPVDGAGRRAGRAGRLAQPRLGGRRGAVAHGRAGLHSVLPVRGRGGLCPAGQALGHAPGDGRHVLDRHRPPGARRGHETQNPGVRLGGTGHRPPGNT